MMARARNPNHVPVPPTLVEAFELKEDSLVWLPCTKCELWRITRCATDDDGTTVTVDDPKTFRCQNQALCLDDESKTGDASNGEALDAVFCSLCGAYRTLKRPFVGDLRRICCWQIGKQCQAMPSTPSQEPAGQPRGSSQDDAAVSVEVELNNSSLAAAKRKFDGFGTYKVRTAVSGSIQKRRQSLDEDRATQDADSLPVSQKKPRSAPGSRKPTPKVAKKDLPAEPANQGDDSDDEEEPTSSAKRKRGSTKKAAPKKKAPTPDPDPEKEEVSEDEEASESDYSDEESDEDSDEEERLPRKAMKKEISSNLRSKKRTPKRISPSGAAAEKMEADDAKTRATARERFNKWIQCDSCDKWRRVSNYTLRAASKLEGPWQCEMIGDGTTCRDLADSVEDDEEDVVEEKPKKAAASSTKKSTEGKKKSAVKASSQAKPKSPERQSSVASSATPARLVTISSTPHRPWIRDADLRNLGRDRQMKYFSKMRKTYLPTVLDTPLPTEPHPLSDVTVTISGYTMANAIRGRFGSPKSMEVVEED